MPNPVVTIESIRAAIIRQEGKPVNPTNPGNLRSAPWIIGPEAAPMRNGFWNPAIIEEGMAGLDHLIALHRAEGNSLTDFIAGEPGVYAGFAPGADGNDDSVYIADVMAWTGITDANAPLWDYL
jgi:hypothetical protein